MNRKLLHTPEGVRDIYGAEFAAKQWCEQKIRKVLLGYGFRDIQTPTFEFFDVFGSDIGTTPSKELYKFFDKEGNTLVLRPDFTPSIARCAAKYYMDTDAPVRFCYQGNTFTNTSDLRGKLKEVTEMGAELIGDDSIAADAEMIALCVESLLHAGLKEFQVSVGEINFIKGLCEGEGMGEETERTLRDLISAKNFFGAQELLLSGGVANPCREALLHIGDLAGGAEILAQARGYARSAVSMRAVDRLEALYRVLCMYGVEKYVSFDLGMVSKYHYYTGIIFKAYTYGVGDAIVKGGRYDRLLERFGKPAPAIGFMIVIDDLLTARKASGAEAHDQPPVKVLLYYETELSQAIAYVTARRAAGERIGMIRISDEDDRKRAEAFVTQDHMQPVVLGGHGETV